MDSSAEASTTKFNSRQFFILSGYSGFLFALTELLLNDAIIGRREFLQFDLRYILFAVLLFLFTGLLGWLIAKIISRDRLNRHPTKEIAFCYSFLLTTILLIYWNTQLNYLKEICGNPDTILDNLFFNIGIFAFGIYFYFFSRRKEPENLILITLVGSIILPIVLSYLGPRFQSGALGSEEFPKFVYYNMFYMCFLSAYLFLVLFKISGLIYKKYGYLVFLMFLSGALLQAKLPSGISLLVYGIIFAIIIITLQKAKQLNSKSALFPLVFFFTMWLVHPYLFSAEFPNIFVQLYSSSGTSSINITTYLFPIIKVTLVILIMRKLAAGFVINSRQQKVSVFATATVFTLFALLVFFQKSVDLETEYENILSSVAPAGLNRDRPNVILIALDTTGQDHLSVYQYLRETTPELSKFAQSSTLFTNGYSTAGYTYPSHASLFTGMYPHVHGLHSKKIGNQNIGVHHRASLTLSSNNLTLAEILKERGYATVAISGHPFLYALNLLEGFDWAIDGDKQWKIHYSVHNLIFRGPLEQLGLFWMDLEMAPRAHCLSREAGNWIKKHEDRPFFMFINYFDAHSPYLPLSKYQSLFADETLLPQYLKESAEIKKNINNYDAEIFYIDKYLGRLFDGLKSMSQFDNTIICLVGDHGESFGEHTLYGHGELNSYNDVIKVPFIIKYPGQHEPAIIDEAVNLVDIFPTVLQVLGYPLPGNIQGKSLSGINSDGAGRPVVTENYSVQADNSIFPRRSIIQSSLKLIELAPDTTKLFDLAEDPLELNDLSLIDTLKSAALKSELDNYIASLDTLQVKDEGLDNRKLSQETIEGLKALGYVK